MPLSRSFSLAYSKQRLMLVRILDAYRQRMWEIDLERMSDGNYSVGDNMVNNRWDESINILTAARRQLLGE